MKISIGINLFNPSHRQNICISSLELLKSKFKEIELYNLQFKDGTDLIEHPSFTTLKCLETKSGDLVPNANNKKLPIVSEMFTCLSNLNTDYFIFTNNDIIISDRLIKLMLKSERECYPTSRLAIENIKDLNDDIVPSDYQIAGFDVFGVKNSWWKENKNKFPDYIIGFPAWDVHYATTMMMFNKKTTLLNKWPPYSFHIIHDSPWKNSSTIPERSWNENIFWIKHKDTVCKIWNDYLFSVLLKRTNQYKTPFENEEQLESLYFRNE